MVTDPDEAAIDTSGDTMRALPDIRYLQADSRLTLGSKLNMGIESARGSIIQKLDDDDYYHPEFLSATAGALAAGGGHDAIVACTSYLVLIAATGEIKLRSKAPYAGGTFCFFKELWRRCPYRDVSAAEDQFFLRDHEEAPRIGIDDPELYCYVRHGEGHAWSHFLESKEKEHGSVTVGESVTEYLRKLPAYSKSLQEYMPEEDRWFYESQAE